MQNLVQLNEKLRRSPRILGTDVRISSWFATSPSTMSGSARSCQGLQKRVLQTTSVVLHRCHLLSLRKIPKVQRMKSSGLTLYERKKCRQQLLFPRKYRKDIHQHLAPSKLDRSHAWRLKMTASQFCVIITHSQWRGQRALPTYTARRALKRSNSCRQLKHPRRRFKRVLHM